MIIDYSYTQEFEKVFNKLKKHPKYKQLADMDGIGKQTDIVKFSKDFFGNRITADTSVDSNSNVEDNSVIAYEVEAAKPVNRLNAYYLLFKYGWKLFGRETAEDLVRGQFLKDYYINDFHKFGTLSYCFNFSCLDVVVKGLPFVKKIKSNPPKHLSSFMGQMVQFVTYASNSIAGAVGLADLLICASWYVDKMFREGLDNGIPDSYMVKQVRQELQSFIYSVNQPFRGGNQSAFTNISIFDNVFLEKMCEEYIFPDGKHPNKDRVIWLQEQYIDLYNETLRETPFTFPVTTACFATDENNNIIDKKFLDFIAEKNKEFCFMNIYAGKTSTLSSCCFDGEVKVNIVSDKFYIMTLKDAYDKYKNQIIKTEFEGKIVEAKVVRLSKKGHKMFKVVLENGRAFICTDNHIHLTDNGEKATTELSCNDSIRMLKNSKVTYVKVAAIEPADIKKRYVYCLEMVDQTSPYFSLANGISTHNCRLRSDRSNEYFNTFGAGGTKIGSASVTTINLPRIAYKSSSVEDFLANLEKMVVKVQKINNIRRYIIQKRIDNGNLPLYTLGFMALKKQYLTCGLNGINEAVEIMGMNTLTEEGQEFVKSILSVVNTTNERLQKVFKCPMNCEQVPSENSAIKLATTDKVLGYNSKYEFYSNQFIPLTTKADLLDRIKLQGMFDKEMTGGAICHLNVDTQIKDKELIKSLIQHAVKAGVVYHAINYNIQECIDGHITVGTEETCSICKKKIVNNYLRVVGFLTNVKNWHKVRRVHDYPHRQFYHKI